MDTIYILFTYIIVPLAGIALIGAIVITLIKKSMTDITCPHCKTGGIASDATACPHCTRDLKTEKK